MLTADRETADYFEEVATACGNPKAAANWVTGELARVLNAGNLTITQTRIPSAGLAELIKLIEDGVISGTIAKMVFESMFNEGKTARHVVEEKGLTQVTDTGAIDAIVDEVIAANPSEAARYRAGEEKLLGFFVGQVMKLSRGKANPGMANEAVKRKLGG